ncbi:MAG TPA: GNAT family N-acetyltransferase [Solirubrobacteraceae bacterium]|nr:GNAT family N-acetyltransferase [Solirubrobacteraceae bacterium]
MTQTLETERLLLRPWGTDDVALLAGLSSNPKVTRYIGLGHTWSAVKAIAVSDRAADHWREHGFGWRVVLELATGQEIGLIAMNRMGDGTQGVDPDEHEIGWWIMPDHWGRGYAAEGARAVTQDAFTELGAPFITARIRPENVASIHVATTIGMAFGFNTVADPGVLVAIYRESAPAASANHQTSAR